MIWTLRIATAALVSLPLLGSGALAHAGEIIVAAGADKATPAAYSRDASGVCRRTYATPVAGGWRIDGTSGDDVIVVSTERIERVCGFAGVRPIDLGSRASLFVYGNGGDDVIWGGGPRLSAFGMYLSGGGGHDILYAGGVMTDFDGGSGNDQILMDGSVTSASGGSGSDLFCSAVDGVFARQGVHYVYGGPGSDHYYGEISFATGSTSVSNDVNDPTQRDRCSLSYLAAFYSALDLTSRETR